jgi:Cu(I)/Ag(I) efflux system protein CusF
MRPLILILAGALALAAAAPIQAATDPAASTAPAPKTGKGVGVITEIDAEHGGITLKHEPIPSLGWPSMTMPFNVDPPSLLKGLKVGQKIGFDASEGHGLPVITAIRKK